jgi:hypothetical protein
MSYQVITKLKRNDVQAFNLLDAHRRTTIRPIFEMVQLPDDTDPEPHLAKALEALKDYKLGSALTVDLNRFAPDTRIDGQPPAKLGFAAMLGQRQRVTPVIHLDSDPLTLRATLEAAEQHQRGLCVRIEGGDVIRAPELMMRGLQRLVREFAYGAPGADLLVDFGKLAFERDNIVIATSAFLRMVDRYGLSFRNVTFAGSTVVDFVNEAAEEPNTTGSVMRTEFAAWMRIARMYGWNRTLHFADYSIIRPGYMDNVPNKNTNAKIRYTSGAAIHYVRGCSREEIPISTQYPRLAERLVNSRFFKSERFSHADAFFANVARGLCNSVDMGHWVQLDSNHHLSYVARQVESFLALTAEQRTSDEQLDAFMVAY